MMVRWKVDKMVAQMAGQKALRKAYLMAEQKALRKVRQMAVQRVRRKVHQKDQQRAVQLAAYSARPMVD